MLLGFKRQFARYVEEGSKTHTVRGFRKIPPRVGEICHCYENPRQKSMRLLGRFECVRVEPITLDFEPKGIAYRLRVTIADQTLTVGEATMFAWRDGFRENTLPTPRDLEAMARFWIASKRLADSLYSRPWHGQVIHWKYLVPKTD
jgi:hypothetical protein